MIGSTNAGGGGGKCFAFINVTYPSGSTCTCTSSSATGSKVLKTKGTSGSWTFRVPFADTWTVRVTNGTKTKDVSVVITTEGQSKSTKITYEYVLVGQGISQNWILHASTYSSNEMSVSTDSTTGVVTCTVGQYKAGYRCVLIDLTDYSKLTFAAYTTNSGEDTSRKGRICIYTKTATVGWNTLGDAGYKSLSSSYPSTSEYIDVSQLTGEYYVGMQAYTDTASATIKVKSMILE